MISQNYKKTEPYVDTRHGAHHIAQIDQVNIKDFSSEAKTWDDMKKHIYMIADALAGGIVKQFPNKF